MADDYYKNDIFGSYQLACECLNDYERTMLFKKSIESLVDADKNVLELGAGTGILSLIAAASGARHVDAVEIAKPVADIARENVRKNGFDDKIQIINKDALAVTIDDLSAIPDVVIMEMISTGLIEELQIPAFNNLIKQNIVKKDCLCSPAVFETFATLINVDYNFYGFEMKTTLHQESWQRNIINKEHSVRNKYHTVDFNEAIRNCIPINSFVEETVEFVVSEPGVINGILLTSEAILDNENRVGWTTALNIPVIIPINDRTVGTGDLVKIIIKYQMGKGLEGLSIRVN